MAPDTPEAAAGGRLARGVKLAIGLIVSAIFLWATLRSVPLARVGELLSTARLSWIAAATGFLAVSFAFRVLRWVTMLHSLGSTVSLRNAAVPFMAGMAFNNLLPFRAGDVIRVVAFQRFTSIGASGQVGSLVLERLLDLLVLMVILFATVGIFQSHAVDPTLLGVLKLVALGLALSILAFIGAPHWLRLVILALEARLPRLRSAGDALLRLSDAIATLSRISLLARLIGLTVLTWVAESGAYFAIGMALSLPFTLEAALLALAVGTLSTLIPSSPGYVGTFHYFISQVISGMGLTQVGAAAYAILIHAVLWVSTTVTGLVLLALSSLRKATGGHAPVAEGGEISHDHA